MKKFEDVLVNPMAGLHGFADIYIPDSSGPYPFIVGIHGGSWKRGDHKSFKHFARRIVPHGMGLVLCSYRLSSDGFNFPAPFEDLVEVLCWLNENGEEYGLDPERCALLGSSAGAHMTALLCTRGIKECRHIVPIRAAVDFFGPTDLALQSRFDHTRDVTITEELMGGSAAELEELYRSASPLYHVHEKMPPMWILHGQSDDIVPIEQSRRFAAALKEAGVECHLREVPDHKHCLTAPATNPPSPAQFICEEEMLAFIKRHLMAEVNAG